MPPSSTKVIASLPLLTASNSAPGSKKGPEVDLPAKRGGIEIKKKFPDVTGPRCSLAPTLHTNQVAYSLSCLETFAFPFSSKMNACTKDDLDFLKTSPRMECTHSGKFLLQTIVWCIVLYRHNYRGKRTTLAIRCLAPPASEEKLHLSLTVKRPSRGDFKIVAGDSTTRPWSGTHMEFANLSGSPAINLRILTLKMCWELRLDKR